MIILIFRIVIFHKNHTICRCQRIFKSKSLWLHSSIILSVVIFSNILIQVVLHFHLCELGEKISLLLFWYMKENLNCNFGIHTYKFSNVVHKKMCLERYFSQTTKIIKDSPVVNCLISKQARKFSCSVQELIPASLQIL
jgi:hypothetical protein